MSILRIEKAFLKESVLEVLDELPPEAMAELLDFALFLKQRSQIRGEMQRPQPKTVSAAHLNKLVGLVAWGGDAIADTERLYET